MQRIILILFLLVSLSGTLKAEAATVTVLPQLHSGAYELDDRHTLYITGVTLGHTRYETVFPPTLTRTPHVKDNSVSYVLKTAEGLRSSDGVSAGMIVSSSSSTNPFVTKPRQKNTYWLVVLHQKSTSTNRINTLALTHVPFSLIFNGATTTTQLSSHELRKFTVSNERISRQPRDEE